MTSYLMITGATGGLGSAFAVECARRGYPLFLTDAHEEGARFAQHLSDTCQVEVRYMACDLTSQQARGEFFAALKAEGLRFWGLINVAGTDFEGAFLERCREEILTILNLNVVSTLDVTQSILRLRDPEKHFMLLNTCSLAAVSPMPFKATYAASKRFLLDFSLALGEEIRPFGTVTALCPAGMPTTVETMRAIFAQGFWGQVTTLNPDVVARQAMDAALRGRRVVVPGWINQILRHAASLVPAGVNVRLVGKRWRQAQQQRAADWQAHPRALENAPARQA